MEIIKQVILRVAWKNSLFMGIGDEIPEQGSPQSNKPNAKAGELLILRTGS